MSIAEREKQILRVRQQGFHPQLNEALISKLKTEVVDPTFSRLNRKNVILI
jgi:hypothetical protein